jgi:membrane protease YdiL (CAAX protease family)
VIVLFVALASAAVISPLAAAAVAALGLHFPFPRIFDRTVMVTLLVVLIIGARWLRFGPLIAAGFRNSRTPVRYALTGIGAAIVAMAVLYGIAIVLGARGAPDISHRLARIPGYLMSAIAVAIIEEAFFRAWLMGGMAEDFGRPAALVLSSIVYAVSHLVRAPAHFYVTDFRPMAGLHDLAASVSQLAHPAIAAPALLGLFLLGILLGEAFLLTGTVYLSMGLHAGVVIGAKLWPAILTPGIPLPHWLAGQPHFGLISGPAAWIVALALIAIVPIIARRASRG